MKEKTHHVYYVQQILPLRIIAMLEVIMIITFFATEKFQDLMSNIKQRKLGPSNSKNILVKVCFQEVQWMLHPMQHSLVLQSAEQSRHQQEPKRVHHLCHHQPSKKYKAIAS